MCCPIAQQRCTRDLCWRPGTRARQYLPTHLSRTLWHELPERVNGAEGFTDGDTQGYLRQRGRQLAAVQQLLESFVRRWGLDTAPNPIATTLHLDRELRIFSKCEKSASLFLKVLPLFPGSLSQHDIVVVNASEVASCPTGTHESFVAQSTAGNAAARLHPVSPELFYETFHKTETRLDSAVDKSQRLTVLVRGEQERLPQQFIELLSAARQQHPVLFHQLNGFDLVYLESALSRKACDQIGLKVSQALNLSTHSGKPSICVHGVTEHEVPAVFALCARSWMGLVSEPGLAIDVLNAGTPCLWSGPCTSENNDTASDLQSHTTLGNVQMTPACLNEAELRRSLIKEQREMLLSHVLPLTARTTIHSHFRSLATYLCEALEEHYIVDPVLLQQMRYQLVTEPHGAFWPVARNRSRSVRYQVHARRRRVKNKWNKLRNSPRQFVRDSSVFKRTFPGRPN